MRALPVIAAALVGCASVPAGPPPPPPEQSFSDVKGVALVHRVSWQGAEPGPGETRRRDPLDALEGALSDRGLKTVTLELGARIAPDLADVDALVRLLELNALSASPQGTGGPAVASVGARAAATLAKLGVEALAVYARGLGMQAPQPPSPFFGEPMLRPPPAPVGAIAVVARDGTVFTYAWGGIDPFEAVGPHNAAEALDAVLGLIAPPPVE